MNPLLLPGLAAATLVSEDLACIAAGLAVASGAIGLAPAVLACAAGIFLGDLLLYAAGRWARRLLPPRWLSHRAAQWLRERGSAAIVFSRFTPGLRLPVYVAAGAVRFRFSSFAGWLAVAAMLWTPMLVVAAAVAGKSAAQSLLHTVAIVPAAILIWRCATDWKMRRRLAGFAGRVRRWEFWPPWLAYIPVVIHIARLAIRYRSLTLFTAANPGIPGGGFKGESKSAILARIAGPGVALTRLIHSVDQIDAYPAVLKPDIGERGRSVSIVRSPAQAAHYLNQASGDVILQPRLGDVEFGVYYCRFPDQPRGRILSVAEKRFPFVTGDGEQTVEQLVLADSRAVCLASVYLGNLDPRRVPAAGERVSLAELGSHCRGSVFLDGSRHLTPAVRDRIEEISRRFAGFSLGRYDIRADSVAAFERGDFWVIELNGVTAEPAHIYDPAVSLAAAYRALFRHWDLAFALGAAHGAPPWPLRTLLRSLRS